MMKRDNSYDVLRWLALTGIILVHSEPCVFWRQLRSFDVPLMVIVSAVCFALSGGGGMCKEACFEYYKKRFIRLVLPSWVFLTFYFSISYMVGVEIGLKKVVMCYTLTTSWYFWIIRILFVMALIAPLLMRYTKPMSNRQLILMCVFGLILTELLSCFRLGYIYKIVLMCLPYAVYYSLGINANRFTNREISFAGIALMVIYAIFAVCLFVGSGEYVLTSQYKYPPQFYYSSYALGVSAILYAYRNKITSFLKSIGLLSFASFVGSHTFWIYLWHIPMVDYMVTRYNSFITFILVYSIAIFITYLQTFLVERVCSHIQSLTVKKNVRMILIG